MAAAPPGGPGSGRYIRDAQQRQQQQPGRRRGMQPPRGPSAQHQQQQQQQPALHEQRPSWQQEPPPPPHESQQQQQEQPCWGYLTGDAADQWTWDDDYNPDAIAKAAAAARQLPLTPRQQKSAAAAAVAAQQRPTVITRVPEQFTRQALSNGVLLVDKPVRWSSADVARQLKLALKVDKIGAGVPLDTEASGLLIVLLGAACRLTPKLEPLERTYSGTLRLGAATNTYDASGTVLEVLPWQHLTDADIAAAGRAFEGEVQQVPCMWSSSKYRNRPLRWYAERGEAVALEPRAVHFESIQLWRTPAAAAPAAASEQQGRRGPEQQQQQLVEEGGADLVHFRVVAGKGASVRVLAHDLGRALGCGAHLAALRREAIGGFSVDNAWSLDVLLPLARKYAKGAKTRRAPAAAT